MQSTKRKLQLISHTLFPTTIAVRASYSIPIQHILCLHRLMENKVELMALKTVTIGEHESPRILEDVEVLKAIAACTNSRSNR